jgi:hypothetical protein
VQRADEEDVIGTLPVACCGAIRETIMVATETGGNGKSGISRWQAGLADAKRLISDASRDERVSVAADATKRAAIRAGQGTAEALKKAQNTVTQEEAWTDMEATQQELVEVACTHHAMLLDLIERVQRLEQLLPEQQS